MHKLRIEGRRNIMGLDVPQPRFSWSSPGLQHVELYRELEDSPFWSAEGEYQLRYNGPALTPKTRYVVKLQDEMTWFETGLMGQPWQAKWIEPEQEDALEEPARPPFGAPPPIPGENLARLRPGQYLRKHFTVKPGLVRAQLYATSIGCYKATVNGQPVSTQKLTPEVTSFPFLQWYQCYDVIDLLQPGENAMGALLTDGWHICRVGLTGVSCQ